MLDLSLKGKRAVVTGASLGIGEAVVKMLSDHGASVTFCARNKDSIKTPWIMAFGFGLLHGLGFAGALLDIGIANNKMLLSLFFFNVGIELAQIALIPIPLILIYIASKINFQNYLQITASLCIGGMGFYWFIDRVIGIIL